MRINNFITIVLALFLALISCTQPTTDKNHPLTTIEEIKEYIKEHFDEEEETIWISEEMLDPEGANLAILTVETLKAGYFPEKFEEKEGSRIYTFKKR